MLFICRAFEFLPLYKRTFSFTPAICKDCTVSRIQPGFSPTCERRAFTPTRKWLCHFCRQRTKFAAFTLSFPQDTTKRDFPFFRKVSFSYLCADERSKSANLLTCLLIKRQSALLTYFLRALFRILPVEFFGISSISMKCLGILYAAILPFMNFRISFSSSV